MTGALQTLVAFSVCWLVTSSLALYPHSLSYFNESISGPTNGAQYLLGSNLDWGQDLRILQWWQLRTRNEQPVRLAYFGFIRPTDLRLKVTALACQTDMPLPTSVLSSNNVAISVNLLFGDSRLIYNDAGALILCDPRCFENFRDLTPQDRIGYSIRLFHRKPNHADSGG